MESVFHILGICSDGHSHIDLSDLIAIGNVNSIWFWLRFWFYSTLFFLSEFIWMR